MADIGSESHDQSLQSILHSYLQARDRGETPDHQALLEAHPDLRAELAEFFADASKLEAIAKLLKTASFGSGSSEASPSLGKIRYFGDYELLKEIARGGMGVVYRAKQVSLNRTVALKMILKGEFASEADVRRFRQEAEAAANLDHPNIVPIYEVGEHEGQQYFSMKLIERGERKAGVREAAETLSKVARAVHHAHQRGILHRDLKPSNILIDKNGEPHVADFGLAKKVEGGEDATKSGAIIGTPAYMAPEQARAERSLTVAVDVWSLGAILYEWLTGRPPFRGDDAVSTLMQVVSDEPARPRSVNAKIDRDLETICLKCLEKEPTRRYGSAEALADDLGRLIHGEPILARPVGSWERLDKWARRRPAIAALSASLIYIVLLSLALVTWKWRDERIARNEAQEARQKEFQRAEAEAKAKNDALLANEEKENILYGNRVSLAQSEWKTGNIRRTKSLLDLCPADRRGWEWHYLRRLCHLEQKTLVGHSSRVHAVAESADSRWIASGDGQGAIRIWDAVSGQLYRKPAGHLQTIRALLFHPDGTHLISAGDDRSIKVWQVATGKLLREIKMTGSIRALALDAKGKWLASGVGADFGSKVEWSLHIHNPNTGDKIASIPSPPITPSKRGISCLAFDPTGSQLCVASESKLTFFQTMDWIPISSAIPHSQTIRSLSYSPDGKRLATVGTEGVVKVWAIQRNDPILPKEPYRVFWSDAMINQAVILPNGRQLAAGGENNCVNLWNIEKGNIEHTLRGHEGYVLSLAIGQGGQTLITASDDKTVKMWDLNSDRSLVRLSENGAQQAMALSPDSLHLATVGGKDVALWRIATGEKIWRKAGSKTYLEVAFSPNAQHLAVADSEGVVTLLNARSGEDEKLWQRHQGPITALAFSPDGLLLASAGEDKVVQLGGLHSDKESHFLKGHGFPIRCLAFSPDGRFLASGAGEVFGRGEIKLWDANKGQPKGERTGLSSIYDVAFSPDGKKLATADSGRKVLVWDLSSENSLHEKANPVLDLKGHYDVVRAVSFSKDGRLLVSGGDDYSLRFWDTHQGQAILTLPIQKNWIREVAFTADNRYLAVCLLFGQGIQILDRGPLVE